MLLKLAHEPIHANVIGNIYHDYINNRHRCSMSVIPSENIQLTKKIEKMEKDIKRIKAQIRVLTSCVKNAQQMPDESDENWSEDCTIS